MIHIPGVFYPSSTEKENCLNGKSCDYGICSECILNISGQNKEEDEEHQQCLERSV